MDQTGSFVVAENVDRLRLQLNVLNSVRNSYRQGLVRVAPTADAAENLAAPTSIPVPLAGLPASGSSDAKDATAAVLLPAAADCQRAPAGASAAAGPETDSTAGHVGSIPTAALQEAAIKDAADRMQEFETLKARLAADRMALGQRALLAEIGLAKAEENARRLDYISETSHRKHESLQLEKLMDGRRKLEQQISNDLRMGIEGLQEELRVERETAALYQREMLTKLDRAQRAVETLQLENEQLQTRLRLTAAELQDTLRASRAATVRNEVLEREWQVWSSQFERNAQDLRDENIRFKELVESQGAEIRTLKREMVGSEVEKLKNQVRELRGRIRDEIERRAAAETQLSLASGPGSQRPAGVGNSRAAGPRAVAGGAAPSSSSSPAEAAVTREATAVASKKVYEKEIQSLRQQNSALMKAKSMIDIQLDKTQAELRTLTARYEAEMGSTMETKRILQQEVDRLRADYESSARHVNEAHATVDKMSEQIVRERGLARARIEELESLHAHETLRRQEAESSLGNAQDEISLLRRALQQEQRMREAERYRLESELQRVLRLSTGISPAGSASSDPVNVQAVAAATITTPGSPPQPQALPWTSGDADAAGAAPNGHVTKVLQLDKSAAYATSTGTAAAAATSSTSSRRKVKDPAFLHLNEDAGGDAHSSEVPAFLLMHPYGARSGDVASLPQQQQQQQQAEEGRTEVPVLSMLAEVRNRRSAGTTSPRHASQLRSPRTTPRSLQERQSQQLAFLSARLSTGGSTSPFAEASSNPSRRKDQHFRRTTVRAGAGSTAGNGNGGSSNSSSSSSRK